MNYNWQKPDWPQFRFNSANIEELTLKFTEKTGRVDGLLSTLPKAEQNETIIDIMVSEAIKNSEIEGEFLSRPDVMSSIKNGLGLKTSTREIRDLRAAGIAELMIYMRKSYAAPLSKTMLLNWHTMLMKGTYRIHSGTWRTHSEPMRIVSGTLGDEIVHYEAPPSNQVPDEMAEFIKWFNNTSPGGKLEIKPAPIRSAIAHLYFESIHPFEDGNGRIGRTLAEKALSQNIGRPILISISESIEQNKAEYYQALKQAQQSPEITEWVIWFTKTLLNAQIKTEEKIEFILKKTKFIDRIKDRINSRQLKVILRMLAAGHQGFQGGMSAKKYMSITKTTKATATRDLQYLSQNNILKTTGKARSTRYHITL